MDASRLGRLTATCKLAAYYLTHKRVEKGSRLADQRRGQQTSRQLRNLPRHQEAVSHLSPSLAGALMMSSGEFCARSIPMRAG